MVINSDWNIASAQGTLVASLLTSHCSCQLLYLQTHGLCPVLTDSDLQDNMRVLGVTLKHLMCGTARPFCGSHGMPAPDWPFMPVRYSMGPVSPPYLIAKTHLGFKTNACSTHWASESIIPCTQETGTILLCSFL